LRLASFCAVSWLGWHPKDNPWPIFFLCVVYQTTPTAPRRAVDFLVRPMEIQWIKRPQGTGRSFRIEFSSRGVCISLAWFRGRNRLRRGVSGPDCRASDPVAAGARSNAWCQVQWGGGGRGHWTWGRIPIGLGAGFPLDLAPQARLPIGRTQKGGRAVVNRWAARRSPGGGNTTKQIHFVPPRGAPASNFAAAACDLWCHVAAGTGAILVSSPMGNRRL